MSLEAIIGLSLTALSTIFIPILKKRYNKKKKKEEKEKKNETIINSIPECLKALQEENKTIKDMINDIKKHQQYTQNELEQYQIQTLKYMINDAFFGFNNIHEIPYETLIIAAEGCDIYVGKGYNHEVGARCQLIYQEIERRQRLRGEDEIYE